MLRGLLAYNVVLAVVPARSIQQPRVATSQTSHRPVSQHLYLRQHQQLHIRQDAEHPADEKGQREERQERDQERKCCEILQDWWEIPSQPWVDCKLYSGHFASIYDKIIFVTGSLCLRCHRLRSFPDYPVRVGGIPLEDLHMFLQNDDVQNQPSIIWSYFSVATLS